MATLKAIATGNWTDAATWALCSSAAELDAENVAQGITTAYQTTQTFVPGAVTVQGICLKLAQRVVSPSGTLTVDLYNSTLAAPVTGTEVTVDQADFPYCTTSNKEGQWHYFKFASPVLLLAGNSYAIRVIASVTNQVNMYRNATGGNFARQLVTTTTQAPAAGDMLILVGDKTGQGTSNDITVTMNNTSTTDYGTGSTLLSSIWVGHNCTLTWGTSSATNYRIRVSGIFGIGQGGTMNMGTTGTPIPTDSTATIEFDCAADGDFGLIAHGGVLNMQGSPRTAGKAVHMCYLNTDEAIGQTVLGVDTDTGWKAGDEIAIASTSTTWTQHEQRTLASDAGASSLTITAGLTFAHDGNSEVAAEVMLLNRNVRVVSLSTTAMAYATCYDQCVADLDWVEFRYCGSSASLKTGVVLWTVTGSFNADNCIVRNSESRGWTVDASGADNITLNNCTSYITTGLGNTGGFHVTSSAATTGVVFTNCTAMAASGYGFYTGSLDVTWDNPRAISCQSGGYVFQASSTATQGGTFDDIYIRSCNTSGMVIYTNSPLVINNITVRRNALYGFLLSSIANAVINNALVIGNGNTDVLPSSAACNVVFNDGVFAGETGYNAPRMYQQNLNNSGTITFNNCTSGVASGVYIAHSWHTALATSGGGVNTIFNDCILEETIEVSVPSSMKFNQRISFVNRDQVEGDYKTYFENGILSADSAIYNEGALSQRLEPSSSVFKLKTPTLRVAVSAGQSVTPSVKVRESVVGDGTAYNGAFPRLLVRENYMLGILADTVLDTATAASEGAWETLSGSTISVTRDGVLEFFVDCDGTTGWINVDAWACSTTNDTLGVEIWQDGLPVSYGNNSSGGGGGGGTTMYVGGLM